MLTRPQTQYASNGSASIAYQVIGDREIDLVYVPALISHLDLDWEDPDFVACMERLASFCRVIRFDKRGTGLSDREVGGLTIDDRMEDLRAVMDAAGSSKAFLMGVSEGGALSLMYSASFPERVHGLILVGCYPRHGYAPDYPEGREMARALGRLEDYIRTSWGTGGLTAMHSPDTDFDDATIDFTGRYERAAASPGAALTHLQWVKEIDVRPIAPAVKVPTLVLHRTGDSLVPVSAGRWLAANIPGARLVEQAGSEHLLEYGDNDVLLDEIQEFLTGTRAVTVPERVLTTVMFTDIVDSTGQPARLGDTKWRQLLGRHHATVRELVNRFRGKEIDNTGDGFLISFDGPARAIKCAVAIRNAVRGLGIQIRAGVHTGECETLGEKLSGIAVHTGARILDYAGPDEVLVTSTVRDLVAGSGMEFEERGRQTLKGIPGTWLLYSAK